MCVERAEYLKRWKEMPDSAETVTALSGVTGSTDVILEKLAINNVSSVAKRQVNDHVCFLLFTPAACSFVILA